MMRHAVIVAIILALVIVTLAVLGTVPFMGGK